MARARPIPTLNWDLPVRDMTGVGDALARGLARLGIRRVGDLLLHLPLRYEDRSRITPLGALRPGANATVEGEVQLAEVAIRRRRSLLVRLHDGTGALMLRFFHFNSGQQAAYVRGARLRCFGEVRAGAAMLEMVHPEVRRIEPGAPPEEARLTPIYPASEGVSQAQLRRLIQRASAVIGELEAGGLRVPATLPSPGEALRRLHAPAASEDGEALAARDHPARRRLAFEELAAHQASLRRLRAQQQRHSAPAIEAAGALRERLLASLPFGLTAAQRRVGDEIRADLARAHPMLRLLQGDVGSGKTLVAALAALDAVEAGFQVALMAPTELLAEQLARNFRRWCGPLGVEVAWLSGSTRARERTAVKRALESGAASIAVGTHALFQDDIAFSRLGLAIIDEQHRFGVHQRLRLREKGAQDGGWPHQLVMTATPIPRSLAMAVYADLDLSVLDERPPGRTPVQTVAVPQSRRAEVVQRLEAVVREGRQAYWVCPLVEESEALSAEAATETVRVLAEALPSVRFGLLHGRLGAEEKERTMAAFSSGALDVLVATTVVEVGVDVPNATLMIIENPERLGLAQLHQLRGRVGRGRHASYCVLLYPSELSEAARARIGILRETDDGFEIARRDLELRGPGEWLGTRQSGEMSFRVADLAADQSLVPQAQAAAEALLREMPEEADRLVRRWVGEGERYGAA